DAQSQGAQRVGPLDERTDEVEPDEGEEGDSPSGGEVRDHSQNDDQDQVDRRGEDQVEEVVQAAEDEVDEAEQPLECGREPGEEVIDTVTERQPRNPEVHQCLPPSLSAATPVVAPAP